MSASGYVKGQITKAAKALNEKLKDMEEKMIEIYNAETTMGSFASDPKATTTYKRQLQEGMAGLVYLTESLRNAWSRGEKYAEQKQEEAERYALVQEFTEHWETNKAEALLYNTSLMLSSANTLKNELEESITTEKKLRNAESTPMNPEYNIQLPKLEIPPFHGDMVEFPEFWELYLIAVHNNPNLGNAAKFVHLKGLLSGRAKDLVTSVQLKPDNYALAVKLLLNTYNRPEVLRNKLVEQLEELPPSGKAPINQRHTFCKVKAIWTQLSNLNEQPGSTPLMRTIRSKFPKRTREKVGEMRSRNDNWTTEDLLTALDSVIDQLEIMEDTDPVSTTQSRSYTTTRKNESPRNARKQRRRNSSRSPTPHSDAQHHRKPITPRCKFCLQNDHKTSHCDEIISPNSKRKLVIKEQLCWKCLNPGHTKHHCRAPLCRYCGRDHHETLCFQKPYNSPSSSISPRRRPRNRDSSTDSYQTEIYSRSGLRRKYRSPSPALRKGRSPTRKGRQQRKGSPYPRVGFRKTSETHTYSSSSPDARSPRPKEEDTDSDNSERSSDEYDEEVFRVNTLRTQTISNTAPREKRNTKIDTMTNYRKSPRLMVVQALTINKTTKQEQFLTVLLDSGSQHSYIKEDTAINLGLKLKDPRKITTLAFGGHSNTEKSYRVKIILQNKTNGTPTTLHLWTRNNITTVPIDPSFDNIFVNNHRKGTSKEIEVDVLIGIDNYWDVVEFNSNRQLPSGLVESKTKLGPVLSGYPVTVSSRTSPVSKEKPTEHHSQDEMDSLVQRLFGIESFETDEERDDIARSIIQQYYDTVQIKNGLIYVQFPWKTEHPPLADNKALAIRRLENQYNKLHHNPKIWDEYCKTFEQQIQSGIIEEVNEKTVQGRWVYYIPHQAVFKEDSATTKLRIVFDASSHMKGVPSLNDCVHQGPTLLPDLCGTLLRARLTPILIIADVEKAFHQIRLQEDQRDATRFLWLKDTTKGPTRDNIRILRFTRIPFGVNASPFLLSMSIKYALERKGKNVLQEEILANTYVDNVLIGAKTVEEGIRKRTQCKDTFSTMGMNLREFMSNNNDVVQSIPLEDRIKSNTTTVKLLGLKWDTQLDTLTTPIKILTKKVNTKPTALKAFASTFGPLGLLTPLFIKAKIFIQDLWIQNYSWDDPFDETTLQKWKCITEDIKGFIRNVPRFITAKENSTKYDLVIFSDASQRAYTAAAYLVCRPKRRKPFSHLLFAKAKLAALKKMSIPRLELLGSVLATQMIRFLRTHLRIPLSSVHLLSDSQIALYWIHSNKQMKTFVNNRVKKVKEVINELIEANIPHRFHFVNTEDNPADCATKGLSASELTNHMWWHGPSFILTPTTTWPNIEMDFTTKPTTTKEAQKEFKSITTTTTTTDTYKSFIPFDKTNSYSKLLRITAYVLKYIACFRQKSKSGTSVNESNYGILTLVSTTKPITADDIKAAEILLLREHYREGILQLQGRAVQRLEVSQDPHGIYRGDLRMANAEIAETAKNPILLLPTHRLTRMIIQETHHKLLHSGASHMIADLRNRYLIPRIRRIVNSVVKKCVTCRRYQGKPFPYPRRPDLPIQRVIRSKPFQNTGLDYFGPLTVRPERGEDTKLWVCLFTCMATRALHLEIVTDNSTSQFVLAFRRFMARRGTPALIFSDNAPTFKLGKEVLTNELREVKENPVVQHFTTSKGLKWKFITPLSPWKGGFYERLVGSVKSALKKTIHRRTVNIWTLQTLISEIESMLNTRPITPVVTNSTDTAFVLRPIDLINPHFTSPNIEAFNNSDQLLVLESQEDLTNSYVLLQESLTTFWNHWQKDYLQNLAERNQNRANSNKNTMKIPTIGEVVLMKQESTPRSLWPLGLVVQINDSANGSIRSVKIKTGNNKILDRSINQLIPLEITSKEETSTKKQPKEREKPTRIQPKRIAKERAANYYPIKGTGKLNEK